MIFHFQLFGRYNWGEAMGEKREEFAINGKYVPSCGGKPVREIEITGLEEKYQNVT
jgi:hypothetical protein